MALLRPVRAERPIPASAAAAADAAAAAAVAAAVVPLLPLLLRLRRLHLCLYLGQRSRNPLGQPAFNALCCILMAAAAPAKRDRTR